MTPGVNSLCEPPQRIHAKPDECGITNSNRASFQARTILWPQLHHCVPRISRPVHRLHLGSTAEQPYPSTLRPVGSSNHCSGMQDYSIRRYLPPSTLSCASSYFHDCWFREWHRGWRVECLDRKYGQCE